jgi:hypothetical protein
MSEQEDTVMDQETRTGEVVSMPPRGGAPAADASEGVAGHAQKRANDIVKLRTLARTVVNLAADIGGHDARHCRPVDELAASNIEELLLGVYDAKTVEMPLAFRKGSAEEDIARQREVERALKR